MRTSGLLLMDTPLPDGQIFVSPIDIMLGSSDATFARAGKGLVSTVVPASTTTIYPIALGDLIMRYGMQDDAQQQFGLATPVNGNQGAQALATPPNTFTTPYGPTGRPPFAASTFGVPVTSRPKGIAINSVSVAYQVLGNPLTSITFGLSKTVFSNGIAPAVTDIIAPAANGLTTAVNAQPALITIANPTQNLMLTTINAEYIAELTFVAPAGSTVNFYGLFLNVAFNYN